MRVQVDLHALRSALCGICLNGNESKGGRHRVAWDKGSKIGPWKVDKRGTVECRAVTLMRGDS